MGRKEQRGRLSAATGTHPPGPRGPARRAPPEKKQNLLPFASNVSIPALPGESIPFREGGPRGAKHSQPPPSSNTPPWQRAPTELSPPPGKGSSGRDGGYGHQRGEKAAARERPPRSPFRVPLVSALQRAGPVWHSAEGPQTTTAHSQAPCGQREDPSHPTHPFTHSPIYTHTHTHRRRHRHRQTRGFIQRKLSGL